MSSERGRERLLGYFSRTSSNGSRSGLDDEVVKTAMRFVGVPGEVTWAGSKWAHVING